MSIRNSFDVARNNAYRDVTQTHPRQLARLRQLAVGPKTSQWRVLDVGCGYHFPTVRLLSGKVGIVCGVDVQEAFLRDGWLATVRANSRQLGITQGVKTGTWQYVFFTEYHRQVCKLTGQSPRFSTLNLSTYDGKRMPYPDESFDIVVSTAVIEHVADLPSFAAECSRVLVSGGYIDMWVHNFYCPSGSHLPRQRWINQPWGHLTGELSTTDLNRLRPEEIQRHFASFFKILRMVPSDSLHRLSGDQGYSRECEDLLTSEWSTRLSHLPEELLTTTGFVLQAQKPEAVAASTDEGR